MIKNLIERLFPRRFDPDMKMVKINWRHSPEQMYTTNIPAFSWVGTAKNDVRPQISDFMTCRESFIDHLRTQIESKQISVPRNRVIFLYGRAISFSASKFSKERFQKQFFEDVKRGVKLLNILESHLKWTRTRMYKTNLTSRNSAAYLITGSSKWMRSPQLLSLYCLILRCGRFEAFKNVTTVRGLFMVATKIVANKLGGPNTADDRGWISVTKDAWLPLLENVDTLYRGRGLDRNYNKKYLTNDSGFSEGIYRLVEGSTRDKELLTRWRVLNATLAKKG